MRWHDGLELTAADVVFSVEQARDPAVDDEGRFPAGEPVFSGANYSLLISIAPAVTEVGDDWTGPLVTERTVATCNQEMAENDHDFVHFAYVHTADSPLQARIDYAELRDPESLEAAPPQLEAPALLALAVFFEPGDPSAGARVRLIDNRVLRPQYNREDLPS